MNETTERVSAQYEQWVYPAPITNLRESVIAGLVDTSDASMFWPNMWPRRRHGRDLQILVAGCGTNQAAFLAFRNPTCQVVGIDLSDASLAHSEHLKAQHKLANLRLRRLDLARVTELGGEFDLIVSTGVLHHLPDVVAGLKALEGVLRPSGVMCLGLYGRHGRLSVYPLQEAFRRIRLEQSHTDVNLIRGLFGLLPGDHPIRAYLSHTDLQHDAAIVDSFLHPSDKAYSIPEIFELLPQAGLAFHGWAERLFYSASANFGANHPILARMADHSTAEEAHLCDLIMQRISLHSFYAARPEFVAANTISFKGDDWLSYFVAWHPKIEVVSRSDAATGRPSKLNRQGAEFELSASLATVLNQSVSERKPLGEVLAFTDASARDAAKAAIQRLWSWNHLFMIMPEPPA